MVDTKETSCRGGCGHVHRRSALRSIALGGVALFAIAGLPGTAAAFTGETITQQGWRRCKRCQILFFALDEDGGLGICPAGGSHEPYRTLYSVQMGRGKPGVRQAGWSWCMHCMALYARVGGDMGVCPGARSPTDKGHVNFSGGYAALLDDGGEDREAGWRWCSKCMGMFYAAGNGGICPDDHAPHNGSASLAYAQLIEPARRP